VLKNKMASLASIFSVGTGYNAGYRILTREAKSRLKEAACNPEACPPFLVPEPQIAAKFYF